MLVVACETEFGTEGRPLVSRVSWGRDSIVLRTPGAGLWPPGVRAKSRIQYCVKNLELVSRALSISERFLGSAYPGCGIANLKDLYLYLCLSIL